MSRIARCSGFYGFKFYCIHLRFSSHFGAFIQGSLTQIYLRCFHNLETKFFVLFVSRKTMSAEYFGFEKRIERCSAAYICSHALSPSFILLCKKRQLQRSCFLFPCCLTLIGIDADTYRHQSQAECRALVVTKVWTLLYCRLNGFLKGERNKVSFYVWEYDILHIWLLLPQRNHGKVFWFWFC